MSKIIDHTRRAILAVAAATSTSLAAQGIALGGSVDPVTIPADDQLAIIQLINRFYHAVDHADPVAFSSVFTSDGTFVARDKNNRVEKEVTGRAALRKLGRALSPRHFISNFLFEPQPDGARVRFSILKINTGVRPPAVDVTAEGDCQVRKVAGAWQLARFDHLFDVEPPSPL